MRTLPIILLVSAEGLLQTPDVGAVRDKLDAYLLAYQPQLSALVADEELFQNDTYQKRTIRSEVAFVGLPGDVGWLGFRRVINVGGKAVKDAGPTLAQLLSDGARDDYDQALLLLQESARYNLGSPRTINLPNLPLELLHPRHRHRFTHLFVANEKVDGRPTVRILAEETSRPTIIQNPASGDYASTVTAWVERDTGRLLRAVVRCRDAAVLKGGGFEAVIYVGFKDDPAVGMLVPKEMNETFFVERKIRGGVGRAKYSNYRRFQTSVRIVPPPQ